MIGFASILASDAIAHALSGGSVPRGVCHPGVASLAHARRRVCPKGVDSQASPSDCASDAAPWSSRPRSCRPWQRPGPRSAQAPRLAPECTPDGLFTVRMAVRVPLCRSTGSTGVPRRSIWPDPASNGSETARYEAISSAATPHWHVGSCFEPKSAERGVKSRTFPLGVRMSGEIRVFALNPV
jgi:hypothetical protein